MTPLGFDNFLAVKSIFSCLWIHNDWHRINTDEKILMKSHSNLLEFTAQAMDDGFEEILQKEWEPNLSLEMHTHPYDVRVQVASGLVRLSLAAGVQTYEAGQGFYLARNTEHAEQYGPHGATFWVARKL